MELPTVAGGGMSMTFRMQLSHMNYIHMHCSELEINVQCHNSMTNQFGIVRFKYSSVQS